MSRHPYPGDNLPSTCDESGSIRITIPKGIRDALELGEDEQPEYYYDTDEREVALRFGD